MSAQTPLASPSADTATPDAQSARFRSGAVARMLRMPVATLRIWERRYQVAAPATSAAGHRLYSAARIQRLALLRQLAGLGHALGAIPPLDMTQLQQVANTHARSLAQARQTPATPLSHPWRVVVVGSELARRLQRPGLMRRLPRPLLIVETAPSLAAVRPVATGLDADALLCQVPGVDPPLAAALAQAGQASRAPAIGLLYSFAPETLCQNLANQGVAMLREPQSDRSLALWLSGLMPDVTAAAAPGGGATRAAAALAPGARPGGTRGGAPAAPTGPAAEAPPQAGDATTWLMTATPPPRRCPRASCPRSSLPIPSTGTRTSSRWGRRT